MRTLLIILGIWVLINVLFVVLMISPRKPQSAKVASRSSEAAPIVAATNYGPKGVLLRHVVIAIALAAFFSLTPPLLEAYDAIKGFVGKRLPGSNKNADGSDRNAQAGEG
ncbi:hypothetical protein JQ607_09170 [Bradyrhizobium liaoningense]|uniref:hypothetical protein n=1 Tax=Bradyrhizobium liaoningense TaxID=43992 RepID=UPI001BA814A5|nr:hypothetical protein [Bradyrhizobium liaoningense]MBR0840363.1 hypothetical protein [Bradyrhizobium liaoningense]